MLGCLQEYYYLQKDIKTLGALIPLGLEAPDSSVLGIIYTRFFFLETFLYFFIFVLHLCIQILEDAFFPLRLGLRFRDEKGD